MEGRVVRLTRKGREKVGADSITTSDDGVLYSGQRIVVTCSETGRTYILDRDDIAFVDEEYCPA